MASPQGAHNFSAWSSRSFSAVQEMSPQAAILYSTNREKKKHYKSNNSKTKEQSSTPVLLPPRCLTGMVFSCVIIYYITRPDVTRITRETTTETRFSFALCRQRGMRMNRWNTNPSRTDNQIRISELFKKSFSIEIYKRQFHSQRTRKMLTETTATATKTEGKNKTHTKKHNFVSVCLSGSSRNLEVA